MADEVAGDRLWRHSWGAAAIGRPVGSCRRARPVRSHGLSIRALAGPPDGIFTVRDFVVPVHRRLAQCVAQAEIVRDVAAFGAVVLFATMLALVLGGDPFL